MIALKKKTLYISGEQLKNAELQLQHTFCVMSFLQHLLSYPNKSFSIGENASNVVCYMGGKASPDVRT